MLIRIERLPPLPSATMGVLLVDGTPKLFTREDPSRPDHVFIPGETCLPPGLFNLTLALSRRFDRALPLLASTLPMVERRRGANRVGMFFHPGDPEIDFGGEILLGKGLDGLTVRQTGEAFSEFSVIIAAALERGEAIEVEIN